MSFNYPVIMVQEIGIDGFVRYVPKKDEWGQSILFETKEEANGTAYSDRLYQWNPEKYNRLCKKHFGDVSQYWNERSLEKIEKFLREYFRKKLTVVKIVTGENRATGYPYWVFYWKNI